MNESEDNEGTNLENNQSNNNSEENNQSTINSEENNQSNNNSEENNQSNNNSEENDESDTNANDEEEIAKEETQEQVSGEKILTEEKANQEEDFDDEFSVGNEYKIISKKYGTTQGDVYFFDPTSKLVLMPTGVTNRVYEFPIIEQFDEDSQESFYGFDPELGIEEIILVKKGPKSGFINWKGLRVGQEIIKYNSDGSAGETYQIEAIDLDNNRIRLKDLESEEVLDIDFNKDVFVFEIKTQVLEEEEKPASAEEIKESLQPDVTLESVEDDGFIDLENLPEVELEEVQQITFKAESEKIYDEFEQKNSFLADLITYLTTVDQKNPKILQKIRTLVEMTSSLKNSVIKRNKDGTPEGLDIISFATLGDLLKSGKSNIVRNVLKTKRVIQGLNQEDIDGIRIAQFLLEIQTNTIENSVEFLDNLGNYPVGEEGVGLPRWYIVLNHYFKNFPLGDEYTGIGFQFQKDGEFFRAGKNGIDDVYTLFVEDVDIPFYKILKFGGRIPTIIEDRGTLGIKSIDTKKNIISYRRGHGPVYRQLENGGIEMVQQGDRAELEGYVLFPYSVAMDGLVGSIRPGKLWYTMLRSMESKKSWITKLIKKYDGIQQDETDIQKILYVSNADASMLTAQFSDYLEFLLKQIIPRGNGDLISLRQDLGIVDIEFSVQQQAIVSQRVKQVIASLKDKIKKMREDLKASEKPAPTLNLLESQEYVNHIRETLATHPQLTEILKDMENRTPGYKNVDIAMFGSLFVYAADYFLATLSGNKAFQDSQRDILTRNKLLKTLHEVQRLYDLKNSLGSAPEVNPCPHVNDLLKRRKIEDDSERFSSMIKFLAEYQGSVDENWVNCSLCNKHLICRHEVLQIQQFTNPKEKDIIQKNIILNYSVGERADQHYICKICGLPIESLDFDKSIEFDDEGRPMMGREVLVDKEALEEEALQNLLGLRLEKPDETVFDSDIQKELAEVLKVLTDELGIEIDSKGFFRIIRLGEANVKQLKNEKTYNDYILAKKKTTGAKVASYAYYLAQNKIAIIAALLLLEIQCHTPPYVVKFVVEGCKPGFDGYPLNENADPKNEDASKGLHYMKCVLLNIKRNQHPWIFGFQTLQSSVRKETVYNLLMTYLKKFITDVSIQAMLQEKRSTKEVERKTLTSQEIIPNGFLPRIETKEEASSASAEAPSIAEGSHGSLGEILKSDAWIRAANKIAESETRIVKGSPYAESACCFNFVLTPGKFWKDANLPNLPQKYIIRPGFSYQTYLYTPIVPRQIETFQTTPSVESAYKLVFKVCYDGPRKGLPHEFGYDRKCDWCGLEIPENLINPDIDKNGNPIIDEDQIKSFLDTQGITLSNEFFNMLLDSTNQKAEFKMYKTPSPEEPIQIVKKLVAVENPPVKDFKQIIAESMHNLKQLGDSPTKVEIANALSKMSNSIEECESIIIEKLSKRSHDFMESILNEAPRNIFEIIRSYFLVPSLRGLLSYDNTSFLKVGKHFLLAEEHTNELNQVLQTHTAYLKGFESFLENADEDIGINPSYLKAYLKIQNFKNQLSEILNQANELRPGRMRIDSKISIEAIEIFYKELMRLILFGPFGELINPDVIPKDQKMEVDPGLSDKFLLEFGRNCLTTYAKERLSYNPTIVKQRIEETREREKQRFISDMNRMSEEERKLEIMKKKLGIGRWAIGGTKITFAYDKDNFEKQRELFAPNYAALRAGGDLGDATAVFNTTGYADAEGVYEAQNGYDVNQYAEDD
jgi:hypothetical protein